MVFRRTYILTNSGGGAPSADPLMRAPAKVRVVSGMLVVSESSATLKVTSPAGTLGSPDSTHYKLSPP